ncbi:hypothetical protein PPACK8108_LOCUS22927 [Phakopsora pachyrhizi]|uniref:Uncharacterized protein n=1 Tax=Phakopsora pachyrhizi TaxID=170000 RepID=A0AAV0BL49_PHAPC|nr:hypothetical protein PPACK8108_LOCUS22927 [Phakopsora pachyrhizi]
MKIWISGILFSTLVCTKASIHHPVTGEGFISRLVNEAAGSHSPGPLPSKQNVQTQSKHLLCQERIYSRTDKPLRISRIEFEDFQRAGKSKRKFEGVFSTQIEGAQAMNRNPWAQAEFNWDFDNFGSTSYHLGRPSESDNSLVWNAQHQNSPGRHKRLCSTNYPSSFRSEFDDLDDLGSFSKNSDYWNAFIEKLRPEATHDLNEVHKNDDAGKNLPTLPLQDPTSLLSLETKNKKHTTFSTYNSQSHLAKLKAHNEADQSSSIDENRMKNHLDNLFKTKKKKKHFMTNKTLGVNGATNLLPASKLDRGVYSIKKNVEGSRAYERYHLIRCLAEFQQIKVEEDELYGGKGNIIAVDEVTMIGLKSFIRGLMKYASSFLPSKNHTKYNKAKFKKYFEEQEFFNEIFANSFSRFLSHNEQPLDKSLLDELKLTIERKKDDGFKSSIMDYLYILEYMTKKNEMDYLLIKESQFHDLKTQENYASETIKVFDRLDWKKIFTADIYVNEVEMMKLILKTKSIPSWAGKYTMYTRSILIIRNLFIAYSTLVNKIFCEGIVDLKENFLKRQTEAIQFFDSIWSLFKTKKFGLLTIEDEDLPISNSLKNEFLNSFICKYTKNHFQIKINTCNKNRNETLWKIMHLWIFNSRYNLHKLLNNQNKKPYFNFKCFLQSMFVCIIKCLE